MRTVGGNRHERLTEVFSKVLWELLLQLWNEEHESVLLRRPPPSLIQAQLEREAGKDFGTQGYCTLRFCLPCSLIVEPEKLRFTLLKLVAGGNRPATQNWR